MVEGRLLILYGEFTEALKEIHEVLQNQYKHKLPSELFYKVDGMKVTFYDSQNTLLTIYFTHKKHVKGSFNVYHELLHKRIIALYDTPSAIKL